MSPNEIQHQRLLLFDGAAMAYSLDLRGSAIRHFDAASRLDDDTKPATTKGNKAVAGYLYGLAGELALKQIMIKSGMRASVGASRGDPFFAHFPAIKAQLSASARGRRQAELLRFAKDPELFKHWDTDMRYAPTEQITQDRVDKWRLQAKQLIGSME